MYILTFHIGCKTVTILGSAVKCFARSLFDPQLYPQHNISAFSAT
nr:MAG TPA: hypothetical protein [Caudoviricetes sp.]